MTATEKSAWTELIVVTITTVGLGCLSPWLGAQATGMFGFLGFLPLSMLWLRRRGEAVVVDERDLKIQQTALFLGFHAALMVALVTLLGLMFWSSKYNDGVVPGVYLGWLLGSQLAVGYGVHAIVCLVAYRGRSIAS